MADPSAAASSSTSSSPFTSHPTSSLPTHLLESFIPHSLYSSTCSNQSDHTDPHERLSSTMVQLPSTSVRALLEACRNVQWQDNLKEQALEEENSSRSGDESSRDGMDLARTGQVEEDAVGGELQSEKPRQSQTVAQAVKALEAKNQELNSIRSSTSRDSLRQRNRTISNSTSASTSKSATSSPELNSVRLNPQQNPSSSPSSNTRKSRKRAQSNENAFDLCCLLQRSVDVVSGLAISKTVDLILGRVLFDSLEEEMRLEKESGTNLFNQLHSDAESQGGGGKESEKDEGKDNQREEEELKARTSLKGKAKEDASSSLGDEALQNSKDFIRNGLSICVVAEEEAVFFGLTHALSKVVNDSMPNSKVLLRLRVPSTSTSSLLSKDFTSDPQQNQKDSKKKYVTFEILQLTSNSNRTGGQANILSNDEIMTRILLRLNGNLRSEPLSSEEEQQRIYHFSIPLKLPESHSKAQAGRHSESSKSATTHQSRFLPKSLADFGSSSEKITTDPTLDILVSFVLSHLKRQSIALHSRNGSRFAEEVSEHLLSWGCDVARFPILKDEDKSELTSQVATESGESGLKGLSPDQVEGILNQEEGKDETGVQPQPPSFTTPPTRTTPEWQRSTAFHTNHSNSNPKVMSQEMTKSQSLEKKHPRSAAAISGKDGRPSLVSFPSDFKPTIEGKGEAGAPLSGVKDPSAESRVVLDPVTGVPFTTEGTTCLNPNPSDTSSHVEDELADPSLNLVPFSFVLIDDDLETLQEELLRLRSAIPLLRSALGDGNHSQSPSTGILDDGSSSKDFGERDSSINASRPPLQHRPRSSPQIQKVLSSQPQSDQNSNHKGTSNQNLGTSDWALTESTSNVNSKDAASSLKSPSDESTRAIIYLTSISKYHQVSEVLVSILNTASTPASWDEKGGEFKHRNDLPQIFVIPKPAGSRRILTTLHSAVLKPKPDPIYQSLSTSNVNNTNRPGLDTRSSREGKESQASSIPGSPAPTIGTPKSAYVVDQPQLANLTDKALKDSQKSLRRDSKGEEVPKSKADLFPKLKVDSSERLAALSVPSDRAGSSSMDLTPPERPSTSGGDTSPAIPAPSSIIAAAGGVASQAGDSSSTGAASHMNPARSSLPSSPMPVDALEYFTETAARMGNSAASGMVIQSPDGRPAGIFFRPQNTKSSANGSSRSINSGVPANRRGSSETNSGPSGQPTLSPAAEGQDGRATGSSEVALQHASAQVSNATGEGASAHSHPHPPSTLTRSRTSGSIPTSETAASPSSARTGSLFSPQIAIESVFSGSQPPMTTPLSLAFRGGGGGAGANSNSSSQTAFSDLAQPSSPRFNTRTHIGKAAEIQSSAVPKNNQAPDSLVEKNTAGKLQVPSKGGRESTSSKKSEEAKEEESSVAKQYVGAIHTVKAADGTGDEASKGKGVSKRVSNKTNGAGGLPNNQAQLNLLAPSSQARQSFASSTPAQAANNGNAVTKPSAMPQSGLLIGAGFTPKYPNRGGPKKAPLREVILPPIKVLIVEDNPINQRILTTFMGRKKIKYEVANNGREAVDKWQKGGFHLILMDIQLPVMDGIEATKEIRKLERAGNIGILPGTPPTSAMPAASPPTIPKRDEWLSPDTIASNPLATANPAPFRPSVIIVALTASVFNSDRVAALAAGCNDFLNKPVSHAWLEKKIIEWGSMQYILLAGFDHHAFSQNLGAAKAIASAVASGPKPTIHSSSNTNSKPGSNNGNNGQNSNGRAALHAAMTNSEIRENFGSGPDKKAQEMAGKLHIAPGKKSKSSSSSFSVGSSSAEERLNFSSSS